MDLKTLVETGKKIIDGIKYVPSEPGVWRTYSVYKVEDRMAYSSWKNLCILYLQNEIKDAQSLKRFEAEAAKFEEHHYQPEHIQNMVGVLDAYLQAGVNIEENSIVQTGDMDKVFIVHGHNEAVLLR